MPTNASTEWWIKAVLLGQFDTAEHSNYQAAKSFIEQQPYQPERLQSILEETKLTWQLADEGLLRIHDRMDKLLTTSLAIFGVIVAVLRIQGGELNLFSGLAISLLVLASSLLLISRLPIYRFAPSELPLLAGDSLKEPDDEDEWTFLMARNYYLARIETDIAASVLSWRMALTIGLVTLALVSLAASLGFGG